MAGWPAGGCPLASWPVRPALLACGLPSSCVEDIAEADCFRQIIRRSRRPSSPCTRAKRRFRSWTTFSSWASVFDPTQRIQRCGERLPVRPRPSGAAQDKRAEGLDRPRFCGFLSHGNKRAPRLEPFRHIEPRRVLSAGQHWRRSRRPETCSNGSGDAEIGQILLDLAEAPPPLEIGQQCVEHTGCVKRIDLWR